MAAAQGYGVEWARSYGSTWTDAGMFVHQRADKSYFIAGRVGLSDVDFSSASGDGVGLAMNVDSAGTMLWAKRLGPSAAFGFYDGCPTNDGNYILVGAVSDATNDTSVSYGEGDAWVVKVDALGEILWERHYGGWEDDAALAVSPAGDGGFFIAGVISQDGVNTPQTNGSMDIWVTRMDSLGNELWQRALGGSTGEMTPSIARTSDGGAILSAVTYSADGDVTTGLSGMTDIWIVKLDGNGNVQWSNTYGCWDGDYSGHIIETSDGNYLMVGSPWTSGGDVSTTFGGVDAWVVKLDAVGNILWERTLGGSEWEEFWEIIEVPGGFMLAGYTASGDGDVSIQYGAGDAWLVLINTNGDLIWERTYGGSGTDYLWDVLLTSDGPVMVGSTYSSDFLQMTNQGWGDVWLLKLSNATNLIGGVLYADMDNDSVQDPTEAGLAYRLVELQNTSELALTDAEGLYEFTVSGMGAFTTEAPDVPYYIKDPAMRTTVLDSIGQEDLTLDFRYDPQGDLVDLEVIITAYSPFRPGQPVMYDVLCRNIGTSPAIASLDVTMSPLLIVDGQTPPATYTNGNELHWDLGILAPMAYTHVLIDATVTTDSTLGAIVTTVAHVGPLTLDADTTNNAAVSASDAIASFDPNAILVDHTTLTEGSYDDVTLEYLILFQNTGTDTAFYVRVDNVLPTGTDLTSFEFVGSSHPLRIEYEGTSKLMRFVFDDILLPDSNTNEPASHGYIRYRLDPLRSLHAGDTIANTVGIYFDLNDPVVTEPALTLVVLEDVGWSVPDGMDLWLIPNPCNDQLTIRWNGSMATAECMIHDLLGRMVRKATVSGNEALVNVAGLAPGTYMAVVKLDDGRRVGKLVVE